jgi:hypothetical protein
MGDDDSMHGVGKFIIGAGATALVTFAAHSWLGLGAAFIDSLESRSRSALGEAGGGLHQLALIRDPALERVAIISGDADAATRATLLAAIRAVPGVRDARWGAGAAPALPPLEGE